MISGYEKKNKPASRPVIWLLLVLAVIVSSGISWGLITNLAAPKTEYAASVKGINNSLNHINDRASGLDNFAGYQYAKMKDFQEDTQIKFEEVDARIADAENRENIIEEDIDSLKTDLGTLYDDTGNLETEIAALVASNNTVKSEVTALKTDRDTLKTDVNGLKTDRDTIKTDVTTLKTVIGGLQLIPTLTSLSTSADNKRSGNIHLVIRSDITQYIALRIEFRPTADKILSATMDASLSSLYTTPPVTITTSAAVVRSGGDYNLFFKGGSDNKYFLGSVFFITNRIYLTARTECTRDIVFTESDISDYEIIILPVQVGDISTMGNTTSSW